jgi:hypothetical protein
MEDVQYYFWSFAFVSRSVLLAIIHEADIIISGILSIFQAEGANAEPITRYAALCSLVSALISLIYGCFFIIRFGSMRRVSRGVEWASVRIQILFNIILGNVTYEFDFKASCSDQSLIWNVYVLLAMPIIWLIWCVAIRRTT